jgi:hypothetical protein
VMLLSESSSYRLWASFCFQKQNETSGCAFQITENIVKVDKPHAVRFYMKIVRASCGMSELEYGIHLAY